ncbi:hypothetical protein [Campylobacter concisus]|uniref:Uncharacterized protein n=1 Tax=Campylobacter concisus TaxID=199 RepID=A0A7S9WVE1_9BACT|nr:hypothetical protein [Campylobacter concisus]QPH94824.1 hypothetical protein CVT08_05085 [Campylobacter concisus]
MRKLLILIIAIINLNAINIRPVQEQKYCKENKDRSKTEQEKIIYEIRCKETLSEKFMKEINNKVKEVKEELNKKGLDTSEKFEISLNEKEAVKSIIEAEIQKIYLQYKERYKNSPEVMEINFWKIQIDEQKDQKKKLEIIMK